MILLTGGTGLIGSHLLYALSKQGKKVRAIYRNKTSIEKTNLIFESYHALDLFNLIEWVEADILDYFALKDIFQDVTHVYHAAAMVSFQARDADQMMKINIEGTENMVNLSLEFNIRKFCYVSSVSSLGEYTNGKCTDEEALWQQTKHTSTYSSSKYYAENSVWRAAQEGLSVVIVNPATVLGFGDWQTSSCTIIKRIYDGLPFYSPGKNGFVSVKDVVNVMIQLMESTIENERYLLVSENISFKLLFDKIAKQLQKKPPRYKANRLLATGIKNLDQARAFLTNSNAILSRESLRTAFKEKCFSANKVRKELNFEFESLDSTIEETSKLYLKHQAQLAKLS